MGFCNAKDTKKTKKEALETSDNSIMLEKNNTSERIYIPLKLIAEIENPDLHLYEGYHFNMDNFIWYVKYSTLGAIETDYNIKVENKEKYNAIECDYVISFGNKLSELYYINELVEDDTATLRYIPYPVFERKHHKNMAYIYMLDKRYNLANPEYTTNLISEINELGIVPYDEK